METFDWQEASRLILWRHWGRLTQDERDEFTAVFSDVTVRSYLRMIQTYRGEEIALVLLDEAIDGERAAVRTKLVSKKTSSRSRIGSSGAKHVEGLRHRDRRHQPPVEFAIADRSPDPARRLRRDDEAAEAEARASLSWNKARRARRSAGSTRAQRAHDRGLIRGGGRRWVAFKGQGHVSFEDLRRLDARLRGDGDDAAVCLVPDHHR